MDYAGSFKYFTIGSIVLSAVSACLALMPFVYIGKIIDEVLSVMPDYSKATNIEEYGMKNYELDLKSNSGSDIAAVLELYNAH